MDERSPLSQRVHRLIALDAALGSSTLGFYTPTGELATLIDEVCDAYQAATPPECAAARAALADCPGALNHLLGSVHAAAERLRNTGRRTWLRRGLAAISLENCRYDARDDLLALTDLCRAAAAAGLDPRADLAELAALSSDEAPRGGMTSVRRMLAGFFVDDAG